MNKLYEQKGGFQEKIELLKNSISKLKNIEEKLTNIDIQIMNKEFLLKKRIENFNEYFSEISNNLYGEQFILSHENKNGNYSLNISSISGNLGTGKKKGQIAAFDLAYIQFAEKNNIKLLHFILHDQIENIHGNQILELITETVSSINCQYIVPVLKDKLPNEIDVEKYELLSLSQDDKLFKVKD